MFKTIRNIALLSASLLLASCSMMEVDRSDCPTGVYITYKYDYNLQHADLREYEVGAVTLYIFDEQGNFVRSQSEANTDAYKPLTDHNYTMHVEGLAPGRYQFLALAGQCDYESQMLTNRAKFRRIDTGDISHMTDLEVILDRREIGLDHLLIDNANLPLDTLWHGMQTRLLEVEPDVPAYDTIPLIRDTKKINITLRELDDPSTINAEDYDISIYDHNSHILWDNSLDETHMVKYTPHYAWTTDDRDEPDEEIDPQSRTTVAGASGKIVHADFMTSRILHHDKNADCGHVVITHIPTGKVVANVNLPDYLSRLRRFENRYRYTDQEFLDRCHDYQLDFFLIGNELKYVDISISAMSWNLRIQREELGQR